MRTTFAWLLASTLAMACPATASAELLAKPPGPLSAEGIARRSGVAKGLVFHYFGSKDDLLEATMRTLLQQLRQDMVDRLATAARPSGVDEQNLFDITHDERKRLVKRIDAAGNVTRYRYTPLSAETLALALSFS